MALGLLLIAMLGAASASVFLFLYGFPIWAVLLAYPATGFTILLPGVLLVGWVRQNRPDGSAAMILTSQSPAGPHPRSPSRPSSP